MFACSCVALFVSHVTKKLPTNSRLGDQKSSCRASPETAAGGGGGMGLSLKTAEPVTAVC